KEGYPIILFTASLSAAAWAIGWSGLGGVLGILALGVLAFFRDPERCPPDGEGLIVAPADGKVVSITKVTQGPLMKKADARVSIFLSPLDVHINRSPIGGKVEDVKHTPGKFIAAYKDDASERNEQNSLRLVDERSREVEVVQVAGVVARRIICRARKSDLLSRGAKFGLIMFGSRTDLYLPASIRIEVLEGQRVKGGETIVGRFV
ncbi:MAG TPA: phosphatidylserine decarboxylase family protein, partial [Candidatus Nitrosocosmicus sp.]|nr:phosphatidylserine decarboxylase family protein [Candidatus Nitrosocosmicus sp.]